MFLKPFRVKSQTAIKGSDRKKLRGELARQFPSVSDDRWMEAVPNKEEMSVMKIYSHSGDNVMVYCLQKNPAFFEVDKIVYPSVYTLWKWPDLIPHFTTWPPVFKKILGGADLMLPGVVTKEEPSPHMFNRIQKAAPCSVKVVGNSAPIAVGKTAMSGEDMFLSAMRGKGVLILHSYCDQLWAHGDKSEPPLIEDTLQQDAEYISDDDSSPASDKSDNNATVSSSSSAEGGEEMSLVESLSLNDDDEEAGATGGVEMRKQDCDNEDEPEMSPQDDMDRLLEHCFLCALKSKIKHSDLPLLTSTFFKNHMMPFCPRDSILDVKKSSHKKLSKFLQVMQQRQLVVVKELSKGVESIVEYDKDHTDLRGFRMSDIREDELTPASSGESEKTQGVSPPEITEVYIISAGMLPFFKSVGHKKGDALTAHEVRTAVINYVRAENLQYQADKGKVTLDALLSDMVLARGEYKETLSWEELVGRFLSKLNPGHIVQLTGQNAVLHKGKLEPIHLNVVQRASNKRVTLVVNLEPYGVDPHQLGHEVQTNMACSTSVTPLPGKNKGSELMIQGNQVTFVVKLLTEKYKIPKKFILGADKAKPGKKKK